MIYESDGLANHHAICSSTKEIEPTYAALQDFISSLGKIAEYALSIVVTLWVVRRIRPLERQPQKPGVSQPVFLQKINCPAGSPVSGAQFVGKRKRMSAVHIIVAQARCIKIFARSYIVSVFLFSMTF